MAFSFEELRRKISPKSVVIKNYELDGNKVVIAKEETDYVIYINEVNISDGFDNIYDAEKEAKVAVSEVIIKKHLNESVVEAFVPTPKDLNRLSDAMKLNSIQKDILFGFMRKGKVTQRYAGKPAG